MADNGLKTPPKPAAHVLDTIWLWVVVFAFVAAEWAILFYPSLCDSFGFMRQLPQAVSCADWPKSETAYLNLKAWIIVSLAQAVIWGAVTFASVRWMVGLWREGETAGRGWRILSAIFRGALFGFGLWFFLEPAPRWDLGCFSSHINARGSAALGYGAVGAATVVMWVLENRVGSLDTSRSGLDVPRKYLDLRQKLQALLSMSSLVLVFGIVGLTTRRSFVALSPKSFFPQPIILEGFEYTVLLALAYAPVHAAFNSVGARIRDGLVAAPTGSDAHALEEWSRASNKLGDLLQLKVYDWKTFGPVFPILAPFLLGLLSDFVKH